MQYISFYIDRVKPYISVTHRPLKEPPMNTATFNAAHRSSHIAQQRRPATARPQAVQVPYPWIGANIQSHLSARALRLMRSGD